jgi:hypothetical protein
LVDRFLLTEESVDEDDVDAQTIYRAVTDSELGFTAMFEQPLPGSLKWRFDPRDVAEDYYEMHVPEDAFGIDGMADCVGELDFLLDPDGSGDGEAVMGLLPCRFFATAAARRDQAFCIRFAKVIAM